jgi:hypothetical protein
MKTHRHLFRVDRREINYLRVTMESYDGMVVVRTQDPREAIIEVLVAPGCELQFAALLTALTDKESMDIIPVEEGQRAGGQ